MKSLYVYIEDDSHDWLMKEKARTKKTMAEIVGNLIIKAMVDKPKAKKKKS